MSEIGDQVLGVFDPHGHPEEVVGVAPLHLLLLRVVDAHGAAEVVQERVDTPEGGPKLEQSQVSVEVAKAVEIVTLDIEGDHAREA